MIVSHKFLQKNHVFLKIFNSEFQAIEVWFTDHNSQPLEIEDKINKGFLSFAKNIGTHATKAAKNINNKYSQKLLDSAKKIYNRCNRTASRRTIQKTAETTGDLFGNRIADKIRKLSKKFLWKFFLKDLGFYQLFYCQL